MQTPPVSAAKVNLSELVDNSRLGPVQWGCSPSALTLIMDASTCSAGVSAPAIVQDLGVPPSALGPVFAAGNLGVLIGSLLFSMLADRVGRRPVLIAATFFFSLITILTARAATIQELLIYRFIAGIGLGSIIPQATALVGEYSPRAKRVTLIMGITVGFTAGAAFGGFIAAALIPAFGWRSVFYFGGIVPFFIAIAMLFWLPESLQFMALRGKRDELVKWLARINPGVPIAPNAELVLQEEKRGGGVPIVHLFREGRSATTILLWIVNFMNLLNLYSLASWLPTVATGAGYPQQTAVLVGAILQTGGTVGTFGLAWLIARRGFIPMLAVSFAIACVSIFLIGQPALSLTMLFVVVFIAGWCVVGSQPGSTRSPKLLPDLHRSTGVGAGLGVGRMGAIVGPLIGGYFIAAKWTTRRSSWRRRSPYFHLV